MNLPLNEEQIASLSAKLSTDNVKTRRGGRDKLAYVEAWYCIDVMNKIFGFAGWSHQIHRLEEVSRVCLQGEGKAARFNVTYLSESVVRVGNAVYRDTGTGHGQNMPIGDAIESASKEAVSDSMKRTLRHLGYQFGLALYDKEFANVTRPGDEPQTSDAPASGKSSESTAGVESTSEERQPAPQARSAAINPPSGNRIATFITACQDEKHRIGYKLYYQVLGDAGFEKSNQIFDDETQKKVFTQFRIFPLLGFFEHVNDLKELFKTVDGGEAAWVDWWFVFPQEISEVPPEGKTACINSLYEHFKFIKK